MIRDVGSAGSMSADSSLVACLTTVSCRRKTLSPRSTGNRNSRAGGCEMKKSARSRGKLASALASSSPPSLSRTPPRAAPAIAEGFSQKSLCQTLITHLFRDHLERFGDQLQLMRFVLEPHSEIFSHRQRSSGSVETRARSVRLDHIHRPCRVAGRV